MSTHSSVAVAKDQQVDTARLQAMLEAMSPKRRVFSEEYAATGNGTQSAITAGYAPKSAHAAATRLLKVDEIGEAVALLRAKAAEDRNISREWLVDELRENHRLARVGNPVLDRYGHPTGKYIKQLAASNKALDQIAELLGYKVDQKHVVVRHVTDMSDDELAAEEARLLAERKQLSGLTATIEGQVETKSTQTIDNKD